MSSKDLKVRGEPILEHELTDVLLAIELGGARRQRQKRDVGWNPEFLRAVPSVLIEDQNGVGALCHLVATSSR
jgi:hypothetical protein